MAEEGLLASQEKSSTSLLSEISNISTRPFVLAFTACSCGAFSFGCIVGYTAPTQSSIMKDLNLSIADYSLFGSILTVGLILGALICGKLTDLVMEYLKKLMREFGVVLAQKKGKKTIISQVPERVSLKTFGPRSRSSVQ